MRVGLTGGCCTGKTTVAEMFSQLGAKVIGADQIVHRLLSEDPEVRSRVISAFGNEVLAADGAIEREKLAGIVFADKESLGRLTDLLYPKVRAEIKRVFEEAGRSGAHRVCVAEVPLLIEGGALDLYDVIVVVSANYENQLERFFGRGGTSKADLDRRIANQMALAEKVKIADYVIDNNGTVSDTFEQVRNVYEDIVGKGDRGCAEAVGATAAPKGGTEQRNEKSKDLDQRR
jgi:dephospho-CoA kinase